MPRTEVRAKRKLKGEELSIPFKLVGCNLATFSGLCSEHDTLLLRNIDTNEIDPANAEHRFLVADRFILKRQHWAVVDKTTSASDRNVSE